MKPRTWVLTILLSIALLATFYALSGCASVSKRETATKTYASVHQLLVSTREVEWAACGVVPTKDLAKTCTNPEAKTIGLTDTKHQQINGQLEDAFRMEKTVGTALLAWRAGDPAPQSLNELVMVSTEVVAVAKTLVGSAGAKILAAAQEVLDAVRKIAEVLAKAPLSSQTLSTTYPTRTLLEAR